MKFVASISGYGTDGSQAVTLVCFHDAESGVLVVDKTMPFADQRPDGFALITNLPLQTRDFLFTEDHIRDSIRDYYAMNGQELIDIDESLMRYRPDGKIEREGIDERGPKFKLSEDIGNGEVAVLAAVAFVMAQEPITGAMEAISDFTKLYTAFEV